MTLHFSFVLLLFFFLVLQVLTTQLMFSTFMYITLMVFLSFVSFLICFVNFILTYSQEVLIALCDLVSKSLKSLIVPPVYWCCCFICLFFGNSYSINLIFCFSCRTFFSLLLLWNGLPFVPILNTVWREIFDMFVLLSPHFILFCYVVSH